MEFVPDVLMLGQFPLAMVALLGLLGGTAAYLMSGWLARRDGQKPDTAQDVVVNLLIGAVVGAKVIYVLLDVRSYIANPGTLLLFPYGPLALPAGLAGGAVAVALGLRRTPGRLAALDLAAAPLALAGAIGAAGWHAPGSWAFAPALAVAAVAALAFALLRPAPAGAPAQAPPPGARAAATIILVAAALALADVARPTGSGGSLQLAAAMAGTAAWLWLNRAWKKDSAT
jgi:hypothetical protein